MTKEKREQFKKEMYKLFLSEEERNKYISYEYFSNGFDKDLELQLLLIVLRDDDADEFIAHETRNSIKFDWNILPSWINTCIAMEKSGRWYAYPYEVHFNGVNMVPVGELSHHFPTMIPEEYSPKGFKGDWTKSVIMNPNKKR